MPPCLHRLAQPLTTRRRMPRGGQGGCARRAPGHQAKTWPALALAVWMGLVLTGGHAGAQPAGEPPTPRSAQEQEVDALLSRALPQAALVMPRAPQGPVVPSQVLRWRTEAAALEHGENGLPRDPARAATLYCQAARHGDAESQYALAWMLTNARGIDRDDAAAAHLFAAAAEQGLTQAERMAARLGTPLGEPPACLRPPEADVPPAALAASRPGLQRPGLAAAPKAPPAMRPLTAHPLYTEAPKPIAEFVRLVAPDYKLPPQLVLAVMATESGFNPNAVSPKQAQGLMQLIPETAARFRVRNLFDPAQNIRGGMAYLRWLLAFFEGDVRLALAAYNAGEGAVERYRGIPPYAETRLYVRKVMALFDETNRLPYDTKITPPSAAMPAIKLAALRPGGLPLFTR